MKKRLFSITLFSLFTLIFLNAQTENIAFSNEKGIQEADRKMPLKRGEIVTLETIKEINSDNVQIGDIIPLRVAKSVSVEGYKLIHQGAYGEAIVRDVKKARGYGRPGIIVLELINVETFDNHRVKLSAQSLLVAEGRNRKGLAWGVSVGSTIVVGVTGVVTLGASGVFLGLPCLSLGAWVKGREAVIKQGKILSGVIKDTTEVGADPNSVNREYYKN